MKTAVRERGILFSAPMVRALLAGRKTQTRRIITPQPPASMDDGWYPDPYNHGPEWTFWGKAGTPDHNKQGHLMGKCPYGAPGDRLWVKEAWQHEDTSCADHKCGQPTHIYFRATDPASDTFSSWRPLIFMPRWASRIGLAIESVRVERLQEIKPEDAVAEGLVSIESRDGSGRLLWNFGERGVGWFDPRVAYQHGWDSINGKRAPWSSNPWVWVLTFKVLS